MHFRMLSLLALFTLAVTLLPARAFAAPPAADATWVANCSGTAQVKSGQWLSQLAEQELGNMMYYPAIQAATNIKHAGDETFVAIVNPDNIPVGSKLCIPDKTKTLGGALVAGTLTTPAFTETKVVLDNGIVGTVNQPTGATKAPAVLMLHGFGSTKDEVGDMYKNLSAKLAEKGIASFRLDFRGWGESGNYMWNSTVDQQVADAQTAYEYLGKLDFVDPARIGIQGFSLGGADAIASVSEHPQQYKSMVTWSSVGDLNKDFVGVVGQANIDNVMKSGQAEIDLGWRKVTLKDAFFKSFNNYNLLEAIKKYPGSYLAIVGSKDFSAAYAKTLVDNSTGTTKEAWIIDGGDHIFQVLSGDATMSNSVINRTAEWFSKTL